jgi:mRNA interferase MazF
MKNFTLWNRQKQDIHNLEKDIIFQEGEIWFSSLGVNIGYEQDGKGQHFLRPVLIIKKMSKNMSIILPLTTKEKTGNWYVEIKNSGGKKAFAALCQIRTIYINRLAYKIGRIKKDELLNIKNMLTQFLGT